MATFLVFILLARILLHRNLRLALFKRTNITALIVKGVQIFCRKSLDRMNKKFRIFCACKSFRNIFVFMRNSRLFSWLFHFIIKIVPTESRHALVVYEDYYLIYFSKRECCIRVNPFSWSVMWERLSILGTALPYLVITRVNEFMHKRSTYTATPLYWDH